MEEVEGEVKDGACGRGEGRGRGGAKFRRPVQRLERRQPAAGQLSSMRLVSHGCKGVRTWDGGAIHVHMLLPQVPAARRAGRSKGAVRCQHWCLPNQCQLGGGQAEVQGGREGCKAPSPQGTPACMAPTGSQPCPHHYAARKTLQGVLAVAYPRGRTNMTATRSFRRYVLPPALSVMVRRTASARLTCDRAYRCLSKEWTCD